MPFGENKEKWKQRKHKRAAARLGCARVLFLLSRSRCVHGDEGGEGKREKKKKKGSIPVMREKEGRRNGPYTSGIRRPVVRVYAVRTSLFFPAARDDRRKGKRRAGWRRGREGAREPDHPSARLPRLIFSPLFTVSLSCGTFQKEREKSLFR